MVSIELWKYTPSVEKIFDIVGKCIVYFTESPYTHVALYVNNCTYDATVWFEDRWRSGVRKRNKRVRGHESMVPNEPLSPEIEDCLQEVAEAYVDSGRPYNILKLLALSIVWNTRWLWKKLKWVPFNHELFGEVCSGFVDEVFRKSRIDLFHDEFEGYTIPGQFMELRGWHKEV